MNGYITGRGFVESRSEAKRGLRSRVITPKNPALWIRSIEIPRTNWGMNQTIYEGSQLGQAGSFPPIPRLPVHLTTLRQIGLTDRAMSTAAPASCIQPGNISPA